MPQLYCDMDGVLVDFEQGIRKLLSGKVPEFYFDNLDDKRYKGKMYRAVRECPDFWINLKPIEEGLVLWEKIKHYNPKILTSPISGDKKCAEQKKQWCTKWLNISPDIVIVEPNKGLYGFDNGSYNVLVDDRQHVIDKFEAGGGKGIRFIGEIDPVMEQIKSLMFF
jgi:hypothetical protein